VGGPPQLLLVRGRLARRRDDLTGAAIKHLYGTRCPGEATCRDRKNPRLGLGLKPTVVQRHDRRDVLVLLATRAPPRLTWRGKAGQERGLERWRGTSRPRQSALFRQGQRRFELIPTMEEKRLRALMPRVGQWLRDHVVRSHVRGCL
jgi:hypothetical protein